MASNLFRSFYKPRPDDLAQIPTPPDAVARFTQADANEHHPAVEFLDAPPLVKASAAEKARFLAWCAAPASLPCVTPFSQWAKRGCTLSMRDEHGHSALQIAIAADPHWYRSAKVDGMLAALNPKSIEHQKLLTESLTPIIDASPEGYTESGLRFARQAGYRFDGETIRNDFYQNDLGLITVLARTGFDFTARLPDDDRYPIWVGRGVQPDQAWSEAYIAARTAKYKEIEHEPAQKLCQSLDAEQYETVQTQLIKLKRKHDIEQDNIHLDGGTGKASFGGRP